ncbi:hypothetical protein PHYSODRAFT_332470 [Phytophthora sojae]|uniref:Uncharacterized protein n=1 Tax=Phytophthora sojae (strain P6497) TaxID=1094619 RepID=G4ZI88_PHYSP|nr:hypothetical protein PHYSODRAFT_332470 [Phytophthora sojae]EGZ18725.1 hypothetical protein PHYSODRAFT_332470 [Phytophthora sojae]|eukprot:XP_009527783.1 hypothetical protein PHYSODRAFT_332470 [Phytophthora sojae]
MTRALGKRRAQTFAVGESGPRRMPTKRQRTNMTAYEEVCFLLSETHLSEDPEVTTVKCKLVSVLVNPPDDGEKAAIAAFVAEIERSVRMLHQIRMEGSRLSNLHFLRCIEEDLPLPAFKREFFARCLAGAGLHRFSATHERWDPELYRTIVQYRSARAETAGYEQPRIAYWSASKNAMAEDMLTNATVIMKEQYYKRTVSYCKLRFNIASNSEMYWQFKEAYEFVGGVSGPIREVAAHLREFLKTQPTAKNIEEKKAY